MASSSLSNFWQEIDKCKSLFESENLSFGIFAIDEENNVIEIDGSTQLKKILFDVSPSIISKWKSANPTRSASSTQPPNTKCFLPFLPPGGISKMNDKQIRRYWKVVMRALLPDRRRDLGYETLK